MAATTRSNSAQNSPIAKRTRNSGSTPSTTPSTTPRKAPQCRQCKRPREGHPRSGCPWADSDKSEKSGSETSTEEPLASALQSMKLGTPQEREEENKAFIRNRRLSAQPSTLVQSDSLLSLSTNSSEIVARLLQPGMFDNIDNESAPGNVGSSRIVRWQETIAETPKKPRTPGRSPMPGTLIPPTPESSFASSFRKEGSLIRNIKVIPPSEDNASFASSSAQRGQPLSRSMSAMERDMFVSKLADEASATIYIIPKLDVDSIQAQAAVLKFITHVFMNDDDDDPQALLILGRDQNSVENLFRKVEEENKTASRRKGNGRPPKASALKAAAGGVVMGAVGAWAGLAFS